MHKSAMDSDIPMPIGVGEDGNGKFSWGYMKHGKWLVKPTYELARSFSEGLAAIKSNGKWGYIDENGSLAVNALYDWAQDFKGGKAKVIFNGKSGLLDKEGKFTQDAVNTAPAYGRPGDLCIYIREYQSDDGSKIVRYALKKRELNEQAIVAFIQRIGTIQKVPNREFPDSMGVFVILPKGTDESSAKSLIDACNASKLKVTLVKADQENPKAAEAHSDALPKESQGMAAHGNPDGLQIYVKEYKSGNGSRIINYLLNGKELDAEKITTALFDISKAPDAPHAVSIILPVGADDETSRYISEVCAKGFRLKVTLVKAGSENTQNDTLQQ
jgi:hypothetical protein